MFAIFWCARFAMSEKLSRRSDFERYGVPSGLSKPPVSYTVSPKLRNYLHPHQSPIVQQIIGNLDSSMLGQKQLGKDSVSFDEAATMFHHIAHANKRLAQGRIALTRLHHKENPRLHGRGFP